MDFPQGFLLKDCSLICPDCQIMFGMRVLADLPPVTSVDIVEADMHRVLPHAALRAALISVCPECGYADWTTKFQRSALSPLLLQPMPEIAFSRKFAMAVKHARAKKLHPLDIAYIAINGLYCARESDESSEDWLELCVFEHSRGLADLDVVGESGTDHLIMAELWRQMCRFDEALPEYDKALMDGTVPEELVRHQLSVLRAANSAPTRLPPYLVRLIFTEAAEFALSPGVNAQDFQQVIVQSHNPMSLFKSDEQSEPTAVPLVRPRWAMDTKYDLAVETDFVDEGEPAEGDNERIPEEILKAIADVEGVAMPAPSADDIEQTGQIAAAIADAPAPAAAAETPAAPAKRVQHAIAVPTSGSTFSLVQSTDSHSQQVPKVTAAAAACDAAPSAKESDGGNPFGGPVRSEPAASEKATEKAVERALKVVQNSSGDKFPVVQFYDGEIAPREKDANAPAAQQTDPSADPSVAKSPQDAIAQVESFLNLTRQTSYQNWIRGYRK